MFNFLALTVLFVLLSACAEQEPDAVENIVVDAAPKAKPVSIDDLQAISIEKVATTDILRRAKSDLEYPLLDYLTAPEVKRWQQTQAADNSVPLQFIVDENLPVFQFIPRGRFHFGDSLGFGEADESPRLEVKVNKAYALSQTEITQRHWQHCVKEKACKRLTVDAADHPVANVSYDMVVTQYLPWIQQKTGLPLRLPTEIEWEYAARAGTIDDFHWGRVASHDYANYGAKICCSGKVFGADLWLETSPVASFEANNFGLYDMLGNVSEWVSGCYEPYDRFVDELCTNEKEAVNRGGSWYDAAKDIRVSNRSRYAKSERISFIGFRLLLELDTLVLASIQNHAKQEAQ